MRKTTLSLFAVAAIAAPAIAATLPVDGEATLALAGTTAAAEPALAGTVIKDSLVPFHTPAGATPVVSGKVQVRVVRGNNPNVLYYYWRIMVDPTSAGNVRGFQAAGFPRGAYDANWRKDGLGTIAPATVAITVVPDNDKYRNYLFNLGTGVGPNQSSRFFFLRSKFPQLGPGSAVGKIKTDGGPVTIAIPLPPSIIAMGAAP